MLLNLKTCSLIYHKREIPLFFSWFWHQPRWQSGCFRWKAVAPWSHLLPSVHTKEWMWGLIRVVSGGKSEPTGEFYPWAGDPEILIKSWLMFLNKHYANKLIPSITQALIPTTNLHWPQQVLPILFYHLYHHHPFLLQLLEFFNVNLRHPILSTISAVVTL